MFSVVFSFDEEPLKNFCTFEEAKKYIMDLQNIVSMECQEMIGKFNIVIDDKVVY